MGLDEELEEGDWAGEENSFYKIVGEVEEILAKEESSLMSEIENHIFQYVVVTNLVSNF